MDFRYRRDGSTTYAEVPFALFLAALGPWVDRLSLLGRLDPRPGTLPHRLPDGPEIVGLPDYAAASSLRALAVALPATLRRMWRAVGDADAVLVFGPHPFALALVAIAAARRRRVVLGVRQHYPDYVRHRHPGRPLLAASGWLLEGAWRACARFCATIAVGPDLAAGYRHSPDVLEIGISLVGERDIATAEQALARRPGDVVRALSVGRLDAEKNPLLLADVGERLQPTGGWRLVVCGDGALAGQLAERVAALGVDDAVELRGYVPVDGGLRDLYRSSDILLHVSFTEGFPQVFYEAFAAGLPVVATEVGGVGQGESREAMVLIPPGDAEAAASALERVARDCELRERLILRGLDFVRERTLEAESRRVAAFVGSVPARDTAP